MELSDDGKDPYIQRNKFPNSEFTLLTLNKDISFNEQFIDWPEVPDPFSQPAVDVLSRSLSMTSTSNSSVLSANSGSSVDSVVLNTSEMQFHLTTPEDIRDQCLKLDSIPKRKRVRLTTEQTRTLNRLFDTDQSPNPQRRHEIAHQLGVEERSVNYWFQNKRSKLKRQQHQQPSSPNSSPPVDKNVSSLHTENTVLLRDDNCSRRYSESSIDFSAASSTSTLVNENSVTSALLYHDNISPNQFQPSTIPSNFNMNFMTPAENNIPIFPNALGPQNVPYMQFAPFNGLNGTYVTPNSVLVSPGLLHTQSQIGILQREVGLRRSSASTDSSASSSVYSGLHRGPSSASTDSSTSSAFSTLRRGYSSASTESSSSSSITHYAIKELPTDQSNFIPQDVSSVYTSFYSKPTQLIPQSIQQPISSNGSYFPNFDQNRFTLPTNNRFSFQSDFSTSFLQPHDPQQLELITNTYQPPFLSEQDLFQQQFPPAVTLALVENSLNLNPLDQFQENNHQQQLYLPNLELQRVHLQQDASQIFLQQDSQHLSNNEPRAGIETLFFA
ncbi:hypothetical protein HK096_001813 [Nowakowskiella sp. JEL0078]|nr:hypothetical protein HK096_001813 [Nowakowskiella sp. JEL0078]